jgi:hypothetical protein
MQRLTEREVRFLCWKIRRGQQLPLYKLNALLDTLKERGRGARARQAANDNPAPFGPGCRERGFLFRRYEHCISLWMKKVLALGAIAGRRSAEYKSLWNETIVARAWVIKARGDYERHLATHHCGGSEGDP